MVSLEPIRVIMHASTHSINCAFCLFFLFLLLVCRLHWIIACFAYALHCNIILCIAPFIVTTVSLHTFRYNCDDRIYDYTIYWTTIELSVNKLCGTKQCSVNARNSTEMKREWKCRETSNCNEYDRFAIEPAFCVSHYVYCHFIRLSKVIFGIKLYSSHLIFRIRNFS